MLIGIVGYIGSGKSTVAEILEQKYGFVSCAFSDELKKAVAEIWDLPYEMLRGLTPESRHFREQPHPNLGYKTPRAVLQLFGTNVGRLIYADTWLNKLRPQIEEYMKANQNVIITDLRFMNEVQAIKNLGGEIWYIERKITAPSKVKIFFAKVLPSWAGRLLKLPHKSECYMEEIKRQADRVISNNSIKAALAMTVLEFIYND